MANRAIVVVDIQNEYFPGGNLELENVEAAANHAAAVISHARASGHTVIHIRHEFTDPEAPFFRSGTPGVEISPIVAPAEGETVILKHYPNSFRDTGLKSHLDDLAIDELVVIGSMSHMCIDATTRAAADMGFPVTVVENACATRALEFGGVKVPAAHVHAAQMAALAFAYANVVTLDEYLAS